MDEPLRTILRIRLEQWQDVKEARSPQPFFGLPTVPEQHLEQAHRANEARKVVFEVFLDWTRICFFRFPASQLPLPRRNAELTPAAYPYGPGHPFGPSAWRARWSKLLGVLSFPLRYSTGRRPGRLPKEVLSILRAALASEARTEPVWLDLTEPSGFLTAVPWEAHLVPMLDRPVLRLSPHRIAARSDSLTFDVVVCAALGNRSGSRGSLRVARHLKALTNGPTPCRLHVFADAGTYQHLRKVFPKSDASAQSGVTLYEPLLSDPDRVPAAQWASANEWTSSSQNAWLDWITRSLPARSVDIVHCFGTGSVINDDGCFVATRPASLGTRLLEAEPIRWVTPPEMEFFCRRLGAWGLVLSTDGVDADRAIRMHAAEVARLRPGVTVTHRTDSDPHGRVLAQTYLYLWRKSPAPTSSSITICANEPNPLMESGLVDRRIHERRRPSAQVLLDDLQLPLDDSVGSAMRLRAMERAASTIPNHARSAAEVAARTGMQDALAIIARALAEPAPRQKQ
jgi:hypothetical protein